MIEEPQSVSQIIINQVANLNLQLDPKTYSQEVLAILCRHLGFPFGAVIVVDGWGQGQVFSVYNINQPYPEWLAGPGVPNENHRIAWVNRIAAQAFLTPWYPALMRAEIATIVWVPLFREQELLGAYVLYDGIIREPKREELAILEQWRVAFALMIRQQEYYDEIKAKDEKLENEITERKKLETELRVTKYISEASGRARTEFLSNMSHEIRTPMNAILGFADILLEEETDPSKIEALEIIHGAGDNLMALINDILDLTKIESGHIEPENIHFSLVKLMEHMERSFQAEATQKDLHFKITCTPELNAMVNGDRYKINKIVVNILKNAFKFTRKGRITVECWYETQAQEAVITVSDTGIGIPEEKQHLIFKAFRQGDGSTTRHFGGTGLGLTIALKLAQVLGGNITLQSSEGVGTTFTIRLPLLFVGSR